MKRKRKQKFLTRLKRMDLSVYVFFSIACLLAYTVTGLVFTALGRDVNDTLTSCFFATFGGEILSCALIKIFKLRGSNNDEGREFNE